MITLRKPNLHGDEPTVLFWDEYNPDQPFVSPPGCLGYRIKVRQGEFVTVVMRFADRSEVRRLIREDGQQKPGALMAANFRADSKSMEVEKQ